MAWNAHAPADQRYDWHKAGSPVGAAAEPLGKASFIIGGAAATHFWGRI